MRGDCTNQYDTGAPTAVRLGQETDERETGSNRNVLLGNDTTCTCTVKESNQQLAVVAEQQKQVRIREKRHGNSLKTKCHENETCL